jgi:Tfp pilus assembly protein PilF
MYDSDRAQHILALQTELARAIDAGRSRAFVLPRLETLAALAEEGSGAWAFAQQYLAELQLTQAPWRAALHARRLSISCPRSDIGHALLALVQLIQQHPKAALTSYRRALALCPKNPWYLHNVGHLLDVTQNEPQQGLPYLTHAHELLPDDDEICASLVHCTARCGDLSLAQRILQAQLALHPTSDALCELRAWLLSVETNETS